MLNWWLPGCIYDSLQGANSKGADQTALMHRLVCTFAVCIQQNQVFLH